MNGLGIQIALDMDMKPIVVADRTQRELCLEMGATHFVDEKKDPAKKVLRLTAGQGPAGVFAIRASDCRWGTHSQYAGKDDMIVVPIHLCKCRPFKHAF